MDEDTKVWERYGRAWKLGELSKRKKTATDAVTQMWSATGLNVKWRSIFKAFSKRQKQGLTWLNMVGTEKEN